MENLNGEVHKALAMSYRRKASSYIEPIPFVEFIGSVIYLVNDA